MNPYFVLGVPRDADDRCIRQAYLEAVKKATPEADPERFKLLNHAYESIKDETCRIQQRLFRIECFGASPTEVFLDHMRWQATPQPLGWEDMKEFLNRCRIPS